MFQFIYICVRNALQNAGWRLPPDRATWICNEDDGIVHVWTSAGDTAERRGKSQGFIALGSLITADGSSHGDLIRRVCCTRSAYDSRSHFWKCRGSSRVQRARLLEMCCQPTLQWASGCWRLLSSGASKAVPTGLFRVRGIIIIIIIAPKDLQFEIKTG